MGSGGGGGGGGGVGGGGGRVGGGGGAGREKYGCQQTTRNVHAEIGSVPGVQEEG